MTETDKGAHAGRKAVRFAWAIAVACPLLVGAILLAVLNQQPGGGWSQPTMKVVVGLIVAAILAAGALVGRQLHNGGVRHE